MNTTMEGNRIIAEFMQHKLNVNPKETPYIYRVNGHDWAAEGLKYHTSWDWLMPVVEKIGKIQGQPIHAYMMRLRNIYAWLDRVNIKETHNAVLEFINWYNTSNRPDGE